MKNKTIISTLESFVYCLLVYLVFFQFSVYKESFLNMNIQPLVIVVGVMALKYGVYKSFQTVFFAFFFYILAFYKLGNDIVLFFLTFENYKYILIFFFTALVLGRFSDVSRKKINDLKNENIELKNRKEIQKKKNLELVNINDRLKTRIINSKESILTLHHITSSILKMKTEEIYTEVIEILMEFLGCDVVSIYMLNYEKKLLRAKIKVGKSLLPNYFQLDKEEKLSEILIKKDIVEIENSKGNLMYASPILQKDRVLGVIIVEKLKYEYRENYIGKLLQVISVWVNNALVQAFEREEKEHRENTYENTNIFKMSYFNEFLQEEKKRKKLFNSSFVAIEGRLKNNNPVEIDKLIKGKIRNTDLVGLDSEFIRLLFVNATTSDTSILISKMEESFNGVEFYEI